VFGAPVAIVCPAEEGAPGWSFCAPPDSGTWFEAAPFKFWETYLTAWLGDPMPPSPAPRADETPPETRRRPGTNSNS